MSPKIPRSTKKGPPYAAGFAIPFVLVVISACVILVVAILLNTTNERRSETAMDSLEKARANARFALDEALSQLQQEAGPDQRITASASILDSDSTTQKIDGLAEPNWTGVWDAWPTWLNATDSATGQTIADTYTPGREKRFRRWLVSGANSAMLKTMAAPKTGTMILDEKTSALLVGKGSAGATDVGTDDPASARLVHASLVELPVSTGQKVASGAYAWWVGDEGVKARINLPSVDPAQPTVESAQLGLNAATERRAGLGWSTNLTTAEPSSPQGRRWLTNAMLSATPSGPTSDDVKPFFHHLTTWSAGVLADVRTGGLKKDLSLLLEMDKLPSPYFGISPSTTIPVRPKTADLPASLYAINLSSWYSLQQHYQLYRIDPSWTVPASPTSIAGQYQPYLQSFDANKVDPDGSVFWLGGKPAIDYYLYDYVNSQGCYRHWTFAKLEMVLQMQREPATPATSKYKLIYNPVYTVWNPYNVTLRIPPISFVTTYIPVRYRSYRNGVMANDWTNLPNVSYTVYLRNSYGPVGSPDHTWIILAPGESRVFSAPAIRAESGPNIELYPGYQPNGGGWAGYLFGGAAIPDAEQVELAVKLDPTKNEAENYQYYVRSTPWEYPNQSYSPWHIALNAVANEIQVVPDQPGQRAVYPPRSNTERIPLANFRAVLKSGQRLDGTAADYPDYRARNFIHANPTTARAAMNSSADKYLASAQYEFVGVRLRGALDRNMPQVAPDNRHSYIGSGNDAAEGQNNWTALEIPTTPPISLGQLQHIKLEPGTRRGDASSRLPGDPQPASHIWDVAANQAYGMSNSFAHPLIPGDKIYQLHTLNRHNFANLYQYDRLADTWDHGFLNNDALFDGWFFSGIAPQSTGSFATKRTMTQVLSDFTDQGKILPHPRLSLWSKQLGGQDMATRLLLSGKPQADGFIKSAAHLLNQGQFNVNSTSVEAWTALFAGLRQRALAWLPPTGTQRLTTSGGTAVAVSRFTLPNSDKEPATAYDPAAWAGIRLLTEAQIRRLAREIVREVKERGPFLNFSDFINRRLSTDEKGVCGALQAAIDWDEKHGRTPSSSDPESINGRFKTSSDMIGSSNISPFRYENPLAATGSRWAGIPGYVIQGDLLTPLAPVLAPRSDTFRIRTYGECRHPMTGRVEARAWCEAIVQRIPEFMDPTDLPEKALSTTVSLNQKLGRRFQIVHFRWLTADEL